MGADIHSFAEIKRDDKWVEIEDEIFSPNDSFGKSKAPFDWRSYGMFGFLANVRNYSSVPPISELKGLPNDSGTLDSPMKESHYKDMSHKQFIDELGDFHSFSFLTLKELLEFDYDKTFEDKRDNNRTVTYREFLSINFFDDIEVLKTLGAPDDVRVVFWFDN